MEVKFHLKGITQTIDEAKSSFYNQTLSSKDIFTIQSYLSNIAIPDNSSVSPFMRTGNSYSSLAIAHYLCLTHPNYLATIPNEYINTNLELYNFNPQYFLNDLENIIYRSDTEYKHELNFISEYLNVRTSNYLIQAIFVNEFVTMSSILGILDDRSEVDLEAINSVDFDQFTQTIGITPTDYYGFLILIWSIASEHYIIDKNIFFKNSQISSNLKDNFDLFIKELSLEHPIDFNNNAFEFCKEFITSRDLYISLLYRYPLIRLNNDLTLITSQKFIEIHIINKMINKIRKVSGIKNSKLQKKMSSNFENFIATLLSDANYEIYKEYSYLSNDVKKSSDIILFEKHGSEEVCTLIQVKLKMPIDCLLHPTNDTTTISEIEKYYDFIERSLNFFREIASNDKHHPDNEHISKRILSCKRIFLLGISPQIPDIFCSQKNRQILEDKIKQSFNDDIFYSNFVKTKNIHNKLNWHIIGASELITFLSTKKSGKTKNKFYVSFMNYIFKTRINEFDITSNKSITDNFRNFIFTPNKHIVVDKSKINNNFNKIIKEIIKRYKLK